MENAIVDIGGFSEMTSSKIENDQIFRQMNYY